MADLNDSKATTNPDSMAAGAATESTIPPGKGGGRVRSEESKRASRGNAVKDSLRSKVVFIQEVAALIVERARVFTEEYRPRT
jgi:hypothetical protein